MAEKLHNLEHFIKNSELGISLDENGNSLNREKKETVGSNENSSNSSEVDKNNGKLVKKLNRNIKLVIIFKINR